MTNETPKDPGIAALIEMIFGILTPLPGMGWIYAGHLSTGLNILMSYWIALIGFVATVTVITVITFGCGSTLIIAWLPLHLLFVFTSTKKLHEFMVTGTTIPINLPILNIPLTPNATYPTPIPSPASPPRQEYQPYQRSAHTPPPLAKPTVIRQGMPGWQVVILLGLTVLATIACLCGGLIGLAAMANQ